MSVASRPRLLVLSPSPTVLTRVHAAFGRECEIAHRSGVAEAATTLAMAPATMVMLEPEDARGAWTAPVVDAARRAHAAVVVVAIVRRSAGWTSATIALLQRRPSAVVIEEDLDLGSVVRALGPRLRATGLLTDVWPMLEPGIPEGLRALVRFVLERSATRLSVRDAALALGLHRKTLWSQCRRHGVGSVQVLMMWCRLIAVAHALRTQARTVDAIANEMDFASPTALRNAIRRYLRITATELRAQGGEARACEAFRDWLAARQGPAVMVGDDA